MKSTSFSSIRSESSGDYVFPSPSYQKDSGDVSDPAETKVPDTNAHSKPPLPIPSRQSQNHTPQQSSTENGNGAGRPSPVKTSSKRNVELSPLMAMYGLSSGGQTNKDHVASSSASSLTTASDSGSSSSTTSKAENAGPPGFHAPIQAQLRWLSSPTGKMFLSRYPKLISMFNSEYRAFAMHPLLLTTCFLCTTPLTLLEGQLESIMHRPDWPKVSFCSTPLYPS